MDLQQGRGAALEEAVHVFEQLYGVIIGGIFEYMAYNGGEKEQQQRAIISMGDTSSTKQLESWRSHVRCSIYVGD